MLHPRRRDAIVPPDPRQHVGRAHLRPPRRHAAHRDRRGADPGGYHADALPWGAGPRRAGSTRSVRRSRGRGWCGPWSRVWQRTRWRAQRRRRTSNGVGSTLFDQDGRIGSASQSLHIDARPDGT